MELAVTINFTIADARGRSAVTKVRVPTGFSVSQYTEFAIAMGNIILAMTDGVMTNISIGVPLSLSGATIRATANGLADVAEKFLMIARTTVAGLLARFSIPTADQSLQTGSGDGIDESDTNVAAYIAILEGGSGGVTPTDKRDNDITDVSTVRMVDIAS